MVEIGDKIQSDVINWSTSYNAKFSIEYGVITLKDFIEWFKNKAERKNHRERIKYFSKENNCYGDLLELCNGKYEWYCGEDFWRNSIYYHCPVELIQINDGWGEYEYIIMFI